VITFCERSAFGRQYGTAVPGKKASCASFVAATGNFGVKPGLVRSVFHKPSMSPAFNGQLHDHFVFGGSRRDRGATVGADGRGLAGAAAHRQFPLALLMVPVFFVSVQRVLERDRDERAEKVQVELRGSTAITRAGG
jgi:hypothetical protein